MKRRKLHVVWLWGLLFLMTACGDDDYYYPSVKLEFVTVEAGEDGRIQTLIPDKGEVLTVSEDRTGSTIAAGKASPLSGISVCIRPSSPASTVTNSSFTEG